MSFLFNLFIPKSNEKRIIINPVGTAFIFGLSKSYCEEFPFQLEGILDEDEYIESLMSINDAIQRY